MNDFEKARKQFARGRALTAEAYQLADLAYLNARLACCASADAADWWLETEQFRLATLTPPLRLKDLLGAL
jgi:hypothetical protein